jgi:hypothetical protein
VRRGGDARVQTDQPARPRTAAGGRRRCDVGIGPAV